MKTLGRSRTIASHAHGVLSPFASERMTGVMRSPYFRTIDAVCPGKVGANGIRLLILVHMANIKGTLKEISVNTSTDRVNNVWLFVDTSNDTIVESNRSLVSSVAFTSLADPEAIWNEIVANATTYQIGLGNTLVATQTLSDITPFASPTESILSLSVQSSTGSVGTQISPTRHAWVLVDASSSTTANIAGNAAVDLVLKVAPTNSATAGDWIVKGRTGNSQALTLAIALQSVQVMKGQMIAFVPKGYYVKLRQPTATGTAAGAFIEARQVLI